MNRKTSTHTLPARSADRACSNKTPPDKRLQFQAKAAVKGGRRREKLSRLVFGCQSGGQRKARLLQRLRWAHPAHIVIKVAPEPQNVRIVRTRLFGDGDCALKHRAARDDLIHEMQR